MSMTPTPPEGATSAPLKDLHDADCPSRDGFYPENCECSHARFGWLLGELVRVTRLAENTYHYGPTEGCDCKLCTEPRAARSRVEAYVAGLEEGLRGWQEVATAENRARYAEYKKLRSLSLPKGPE